MLELFVGFVAVRRILLLKEGYCSKLYKTAHLAIILPMVLKKGSFKIKNKNL